jgi:hypothetical protein
MERGFGTERMKAGDEIIVITRSSSRWQRRLKGWSERRCMSSDSQSPVRISRPFLSALVSAY